MARNAEVSLLAMSTRAATAVSADQTNDVFRGAHVVLDMASTASGQTVTVTVQGKVPQSTSYYTVLASTAVGTTGRHVFKVYPGIPGLANAVANDMLPHTWRVNAALASTDAIAFSVGAHLVI